MTRFVAVETCGECPRFTPAELWSGRGFCATTGETVAIKGLGALCPLPDGDAIRDVDAAPISARQREEGEG